MQADGGGAIPGFPGPNFLVIGAMKCATSTIHEQLAHQPGIFMTTPKELDFFNDDANYARGVEWYLAHFKAGANAVWRGESSTGYSKLPTYPRACDRIHAHFPDIRLIYVMRQPVERLLSHYVHEVTRRTIPRNLPITEAIAKFPELVDYSCYGRQLAPYIAAFGAARILPLFAERFRSGPQSELARIEKFLGCEGALAWSAAAARHNVSSERMMANGLLRLIIFNPTLQKWRQAVLPTAWRRRIRVRLAAGVEKPVIPEALRQELEDRFDQDLRRLVADFGIHLDCRNWHQQVHLDDCAHNGE